MSTPAGQRSIIGNPYIASSSYNCYRCQFPEGRNFLRNFVEITTPYCADVHCLLTNTIWPAWTENEECPNSSCLGGNSCFLLALNLANDVPFGAPLKNFRNATKRYQIHSFVDELLLGIIVIEEYVKRMMLRTRFKRRGQDVPQTWAGDWFPSTLNCVTDDTNT